MKAFTQTYWVSSHWGQACPSGAGQGIFQSNPRQGWKVHTCASFFSLAPLFDSFWFSSFLAPARCGGGSGSSWGCSFPQCHRERARTVFLSQGGFLRRTGEGEQPFGCESAAFPSHPGDKVASLPNWSTEVPRDSVWWDLEKVRAGSRHATCS